MQQTCLKCGRVHTAAGEVPAVACPECGAIYAKVAQVMAAGEAAAEQAAAQKAAIELAVAEKAARRQPGLDAVADKRPVPEKASAGLVLIVLVAGAIGWYAWYDRAQFRAEVKAREEQRVQQSERKREASESESARARAERSRVEAEQRAREVAAARAAMTPRQRREEELRTQFSLWDGSHRAAEQAIQSLMHNPKSYEHVGTTYVDHGAGRGITVHTRFRGTNAFNAVITNRATVEVNAAGQVTSVKIDR